MMDKNEQVVEKPQVDVDGSVGEATAPGLDPEIEAEAIREGWQPKDKFRGRESDWVDAETFMKQAHAVRPILKRNNERLTRELNEARKELNELKLTTSEFATEFAKMRENAYKRAIGDLKAQRREALKEDNLELVDDLEERIDSLKDEQAKKAGPAPAPAPKPAAEPDLTEFREWQKENPWYDEEKEPDLFDAAEAVALRLRRNRKDLTGRPFMDEVVKQVRAKFPDKFENPRRKSAPHEGGGNRGEGKRGKTYSDLPPEAKATCDRWVKNGLMTKEAYVDAYEWE
jgi:hypothetical protein